MVDALVFDLHISEYQRLDKKDLRNEASSAIWLLILCPGFDAMSGSLSRINTGMLDVKHPQSSPLLLSI